MILSNFRARTSNDTHWHPAFSFPDFRTLLHFWITKYLSTYLSTHIINQGSTHLSTQGIYLHTHIINQDVCKSSSRGTIPTFASYYIHDEYLPIIPANLWHWSWQLSINKEKESYLYIKLVIHDYDKLLSKLNRQLYDHEQHVNNKKPTTMGWNRNVWRYNQLWSPA